MWVSGGFPEVSCTATSENLQQRKQEMHHVPAARWHQVALHFKLAMAMTETQNTWVKKRKGTSGVWYIRQMPKNLKKKTLLEKEFSFKCDKLKECRNYIITAVFVKAEIVCCFPLNPPLCLQPCFFKLVLLLYWTGDINYKPESVFCDLERTEDIWLSKMTRRVMGLALDFT